MNNDLQNNDNWIYGYKIFSNDTYWKNNEQIELQKIYMYPDNKKDDGFHFCKNIEDTFIFFRYTDEASIYQVCGSGNIVTYENDYYGVYDIYAVEKLKILKEITREEIINYFLDFNSNFCSDRLLRFIQLFPLNEDEIKLFSKNFQKQDRVIRYINYYQKGDEDAFVRKLKKD